MDTGMIRRPGVGAGSSDTQYLVALIMEEIGEGAQYVMGRNSNGISGLAILKPLEWETRFFEMPMAGLQLIVGPGDREAVAR